MDKKPKEETREEKLQKEWLKKNKPKVLPTVYLDNPYKQSGKGVKHDF